MIKPMSNKSPAMLDAIEKMFPGTRERIERSECPLCERPIDPYRDFKDPLSLKEYEVSGMCQHCIDMSHLPVVASAVLSG